MKRLIIYLYIATISIYAQSQTKDNSEKKHSIEKKEPKSENEKDTYPSVEWKPKNGDSIPHQDRNSYPGVEWTPKK